jgi:formamidopyrimidine-DNA glycosylase
LARRLLGYFRHSFAVCDREGAARPRRRRHGTITRIVLGGRSMFYCPARQK